VITLAQRAARYCMIIALPHGRTADKVAAARTARITTLPAQRCRSLAWNRGKEMTGLADKVRTGGGFARR
jgi:transposase, IS30 family